MSQIDEHTLRGRAGAPRKLFEGRLDGARARRIVAHLSAERLGLAAVLLISGFLNLFRISREGYANTYYAATVKSMLIGWRYFFFVSFDPGGFVSVDKPPLGFWIQAASAKLFGFHGWSLLLPEALAGALSVALLYHLVRRAWGPAAGLLAALGLALTPVAVAVNRNNTIDSLLVLTLLAAVWAVQRATETGRLRWLLLGMALVGLGFNIKMLQAYLALPALVLLYLVASPRGWWPRVAQLAAGGAMLAAVSFAWIAVVDLTPASSRPYVGSSQNNSALELALGYNGLQRLLGINRSGAPVGSQQLARPAQTGAGPAADAAQDGADAPAGDGAAAGALAGVAGRALLQGELGGPPGAGGGMFNNGDAGPLRLFDVQLGGQASWLLALAVLGAVVAVVQVGPLRRRDRRWQSVLLWSAWLLPAAGFFSVASFFHSYYLVMLAPPVAALAGIGLVALWRSGQTGGWRIGLLPLALLVSAAVQGYLLHAYPSWSHWLTPLVIALGVLAAIAAVAVRLPLFSRRTLAPRRGAAALVVAGVFLAPALWSVATIRNPGGRLPAGGPAVAGGFGGAPLLAAGARLGFPDDDAQARQALEDGAPAPRTAAAPVAAARPRSTTGAPFDLPPGEPAAPGAGASGNASGPVVPDGPDGRANTGVPGADSGPLGPAGPGGPGGPVDAALIRYLQANRGGYRFLVATPSSRSADTIILQTGEPVMALGGFSGGDPILTSEDLARLVANGAVRYFLIGGGGPGGGALTSWITAHATAVPASAWGGAASNGLRLYEVTAPAASQ